jgi:gliding motility-associated-like protein
MKKTTLLSGTISLPQNLLKKLLLSCFAMVTLLSSYATSYTSVGGNWSAPASWSPAAPAGGPVNGDVVTISTGTITVDIATAVCSGVTINGGTLVLKNLVGGLTVNGPWVFTSGTFTPNVQTVTFGTGGSIGGAIATSFYNLTINTTSSTDVVSLLTSGVSILYASGGSVLTLTNGIFKIGAGNTLNLGSNQIVSIIATGGNFAHSGDGAGDTDADGGTILVDGAAAGGGGNPFTVTATAANILQFYNLQFGTVLGNSNNNWKITNAGSVKINNLLTIQDNNWSLGSGNPPIYGANSTLSINNNNQGFTIPAGSNAAKLWTANAGIIGTTPGYPNNLILTNVGISQGGYKNGNGWVPGAISLGINGVLTLGSGATNAQVDFSNLTAFTCGGFVINPGTRFTAPKTGIMTVNGNWTDNQAQVFSSGTPSNPTNPTAGFYINATSTINFGGPGTCGAANTIQAPGAGTETFYNVGIINGTYTKLNSPVTITNNLVLTSGILGTSNPTNILSVTNNATTAITGGGAGTYIDGPVKWSLQAAAGVYNFPVGSNGVACANDYLPFSLNKVASSAVTATVQALTPGSGGTTDATLGVLSSTEYWSFATSAALSAGSKISVARPTPIAPLDSIAQSTTATGTYTSIGGTAVADGVNNSSPIGTNTSLFFTLGGPTLVATLPATSITTTSATLNGTFNTQGTSLTTSFSYGTTTSSGLGTPPSLHTPITSTTSRLDSALITGLTANTLYTFVATDGANSGNNVTFITAPNPPVVGTPTAPTFSGFTAHWTAPASMGPATYTYTVEVSTDPTFSTIAATQSGIGSGTLSTVFNSLALGTTYYFRVRADNATASSTWSATSTSITTLSTPTPVCNTGQSIETSAPPVIDGTVDPSWAGVFTNTISNDVVQGTHPGGPEAGFAAQWRSQWDATNLYLLVQVTDPVWYPDFHGLDPYFYNYDAVEVYLSGNHNTGTSYGANDVQYGFSTATAAAGSNALVNLGTTGSSASKTGVIYSIVASPGGYTAEIEIPWSALGITSPSMNNVIGLDVGIDENHSTPDPDGTGDVAGLMGGLYRDVQYQWHSTASDNFTNPSHFGSVPLTAPPSVPDAGADQAICINVNSTTLTATPPSVGAGSWSILSGPSTVTSQFSSLSDPAATFTPAGGTGTYTLLWNVTNNPCTFPVNAPDTVLVTDNPLPVVGINTVDSTEENTQITLNGSPANPGNIATWSVSPSGTVENIHDFVTTATPAVTSTYTLGVTDPNGCSASAQRTVITTPVSGCLLVIPNAFTPNGDGINDLWKIQSSCYTNLTVDVYNRWGSLMYHSDNYNDANAWDGKYHGENVPDATYYYVVKATGPNGSPTKKGSLTIIR